MRAVVLVAAAGLSIAAGVTGYLRADLGIFVVGWVGAAASLGPLAYLLGRGRWSRAVSTATMSVSLLLVFAMPLEPLYRFWSRAASAPTDAERVYSFSDAGGDPEAFRRWWTRFLGEFFRTKDLYSTRNALFPFVHLPGARARFFDSEIRINHFGFRGPDVSAGKGAHYRIIALGASTTFGVTLDATDRPWPEVLEALIAQELACDRPVQVLNAGVNGLDLAYNLLRLPRDILPLRPDLLVSYHGHTGFAHFRRHRHPLDEPAESLRPPDRASKLLRALEERVRLWRYRRRVALEAMVRTQEVALRLAETPYASSYRRLVEIVREAGSGLVLLTHNLAVTADSPEAVIRFYAGSFPEVRAIIAANELHTRLVRDIGRERGVPVVDTSRDLDGAWSDAYIDLVHYTQLGRDRLAGNVLDGLLPILAREAGCRPASTVSQE